ncbi:hypothetical protein AB0K09_33735, partial [Streptomyces sp. NPDC049577]|uniref:hypothetical protein n=1 Tax=Streptomyces sp. NPDC049577 TaxID=3155153 RepID=UPI00343A6D0C
RPTCVYVETGTADTVSGAPPAQAWWDVPVAEAAAARALDWTPRHGLDDSLAALWDAVRSRPVESAR